MRTELVGCTSVRGRSALWALAAPMTVETNRAAYINAPKEETPLLPQPERAVFAGMSARMLGNCLMSGAGFLADAYDLFVINIGELLPMTHAAPVVLSTLSPSCPWMSRLCLLLA